MTDIKLCRIQDTCPDYKPMKGLPPNHDVRTKHICQVSLEGCDTDVMIRLKHGETIACNIEEVKRKKLGG